MIKKHLTEWFDSQFWPKYLLLMKTPFPTKWKAGVGGEALTAILKLKPSENIRDRIIKHLDDQIAHRLEVYQRMGDNYTEYVKYKKFYCNRQARTWINNMGWVDDFPEIENKPARQRQISHPSHKVWSGH